MKGNGRLTLVTTVLALGLVALLHSEAVSTLVLARNIGIEQDDGHRARGRCGSGFLAHGVRLLHDADRRDGELQPPGFKPGRNRRVQRSSQQL